MRLWCTVDRSGRQAIPSSTNGRSDAREETQWFRKIALEEHFLCPGFEDYWAPTVVDVAPEPRERLLQKLMDFGDARLQAMDEGGIERSILSLSGPGVQVEPDKSLAVANARKANDYLAKEVAKRPDRYSGFAHLALQDGHAAADELSRCVKDFGFKGALINGNTHGIYLDDPSLEPLWERAQHLDVPLYLHPGDPESAMPVLEGHKGLKRATWEWDGGGPALTPCALSSAVYSTNIRAPRSFSVTLARHCPIFCGVSTAAPSFTA